MKLAKIVLVFSFMIGFTAICIGQEVGKKKIMVTKKVTDANGEVRTEQVILEGEEAEKYMKETKNELGLEGGVTHIRKEIEVSGKQSDVEKKKHIIIKVKDDQGQEKTIEWNGEEEMPADLQQHLKESNTEIDVEEMVNGEVRVVVRTSDEKSKLGIIAENHVEGVKIIDMVKGSIAEEAGLLVNDIIYEVGGKTVGSTLQLNAQLEAIEEGSVARVLLLRNGEKKTIDINQ
jgi:hypothetical protein